MLEEGQSLFYTRELFAWYRWSFPKPTHPHFGDFSVLSIVIWWYWHGIDIGIICIRIEIIIDNCSIGMWSIDIDNIDIDSIGREEFDMFEREWIVWNGALGTPQVAEGHILEQGPCSRF